MSVLYCNILFSDTFFTNTKLKPFNCLTTVENIFAFDCFFFSVIIEGDQKALK